MKKIGCALLAGMLLIGSLPGALAETYYTLPEVREQAAGGWHETYTDKYGRETTVDIDVEVFGEDVAPVLRLTDPDDDWPIPELLDEGAEMETTESRFYVNMNYPWQSIAPPKRVGGKRYNVYSSSGERVDFDEAYLADYGNDMTLGEAYEFLWAFLEKHGIDKNRFNYEYPQQFYAICGMDQKTNTPKSVGFYHMNLYAQFYGLPVFMHAMNGFTHSGWPSYEPNVTFEIRDSDEYRVCIDAMKEGEMLAEDIPLCSFDKVIETLEEQIEAGHIQKVNSLRFGYALYNEPGHPAERRDLDRWDDADCYAVPSWVIECGYVSNPKQNWMDLVEAELKAIAPEGELEYALAEANAMANKTRLIVVNAQTGEILDPEDTSKGKTNNSPDGTGDADYKGFISWNDVQ